MSYILKSNTNKNRYKAEPGDIVIDQDQRRVYLIAQDGSRRRAKHPNVIASAKEKLAELKAKEEEDKAAEQLRRDHPLTAVDTLSPLMDFHSDSIKRIL